MEQLDPLGGLVSRTGELRSDCAVLRKVFEPELDDGIISFHEIKVRDLVLTFRFPLCSQRSVKVLGCAFELG